jgi:hypothetical protein
MQAAGPRGLVVATGSLFVVAEVRAAWEELQLAALESRAQGSVFTNR